jgi:DNA-binding MarR family transcriptional regulator
MFPETLGMKLRGAYLTFHRFGDTFVNQFGVSADQFVVMSLLAEAEGVTQRVIVTRAFSDANTIGEMLRRLERKDLVRREDHPNDGRARRVFLTPQGRALQRQIWECWQGYLRRIDRIYSPEELHTLKKLLERIPGAVAACANAVKGPTT